MVKINETSISVLRLDSWKPNVNKMEGNPVLLFDQSILPNDMLKDIIELVLHN